AITASWSTTGLSTLTMRDGGFEGLSGSDLPSSCNCATNHLTSFTAAWETEPATLPTSSPSTGSPSGVSWSAVASAPTVLIVNAAVVGAAIFLLMFAAAYDR